MAYITFTAQEWLQPLQKLDHKDRTRFRDSCLFGIFLHDKRERELLAGFGYGMSHFVRSYISAVKQGAFYQNLHHKYELLIPDMPLSRYEQNIALSETYLDLSVDAERFRDDSELFDSDLRDYLYKLQELFNTNLELSSVLEVTKRNKQLVSTIGGEIVSSQLFSRMHLNQDAERFEHRIDPTLSFSQDGRGELSFFPSDYWIESAKIEPWCIKFDMLEFKKALEVCLYVFCQKMVALDRQISDSLRVTFQNAKNGLRTAETFDLEAGKVNVEIQPKYVFDAKDWRRR